MFNYITLVHNFNTKLQPYNWIKMLQIVLERYCSLKIYSHDRKEKLVMRFDDIFDMARIVAL